MPMLQSMLPSVAEERGKLETDEINEMQKVSIQSVARLMIADAVAPASSPADFGDEDIRRYRKSLADL
ncbi:MAG: hypothetical protein ACRD1N_05995 [Terriglobia bacterium]